MKSVNHSLELKMLSWDIGLVRICRVMEFEEGVLTPQVLYPEITAEQLDRNRDWMELGLLDPATNRLLMAIHSFVIHTPDNIILVDTCSGNDRERPHKQRYHMKNWPYLENLAAAGYTPDDIDFVLCTHMHADHVGWNTRLVDCKWTPTFPNARYLFSQEEWAHWKTEELRKQYTDDPYFEDSLLPILNAGLADLVPMDYVIDPYVSLLPTPGHTPGHVCVRIDSEGANAVLSGDLMHTPLQVVEPNLNSCFCVDRDQARKTRRSFLENYADTGVLILPAHFATPVGGTIARNGSMFNFQFSSMTDSSSSTDTSNIIEEP